MAFDRQRPPLDWKSAVWLPVWLLGLGIISWQGQFSGQSSGTPLSPHNTGNIPFWWDVLIVAVFALVIYYWAMATRLPRREMMYLVERQSGVEEPDVPVGHCTVAATSRRSTSACAAARRFRSRPPMRPNPAFSRRLPPGGRQVPGRRAYCADPAPRLRALAAPGWQGPPGARASQPRIRPQARQHTHAPPRRRLGGSGPKRPGARRKR
jgi:hypothetical protein